MNIGKIILLTACISCIGFTGAMIIWNLRELIRPAPAGFTRRLSGWIPVWKLFAPADFISDYCLLGRAQLSDEWSCIMLPEARRWYHIFWNPKAELYKYVSNCAAAIQYSDGDDSSTLALARHALHEFACAELETEDAELQSAINIGTVTTGVYHSSFVRGFTITSSSHRQ